MREKLGNQSMEWEKGKLLSQGKGKRLYTVKTRPECIWMEFLDDLTAFNGKKRSSFQGKGACNRDLSSLVFRYLAREGISCHWLADVGEQAMICKALAMIPLEVVVRNRLAGSTARKFHKKEGSALEQPLVELYYKKDEWGDPFLSTEQALALKLVKQKKIIQDMQDRALQVNEKLIYFFQQVGLQLIDFKLEFGEQNEVMVGDEVSCDSCRLWRGGSEERMDKDRFRLNLGGVERAYRKVLELLTKRWGQELKHEV